MSASSASGEGIGCPVCGAPLEPAAESGLRCTGAKRHAFPHHAGKYDPAYAARYAALWAFGFETVHLGLDEPLYRTVSSLVAESLAGRGEAGPPPVIVDAGCGVGRVATDCAALAPGGRVVAADLSPAMLDLARRIGRGDGPVEIDLSHLGFAGPLSIPPRPRPNLDLLRADVEELPLADGCADLALSVNVVDRLPAGPERTIRECHRVLRRGGRLIFTDPFNWTEARLWRAYPNAEAVREFIESCGFSIDTWFDSLPYREILDRRGSVEEFRTLVVRATKTGA